MDNRKLILAVYLSAAAIVWFMSRSTIQWCYLTFYQIRRLAGIVYIREALPVILGAITFFILFKHPAVNAFAEDVISELKKVTWPSRDDVVKSTTVVLICVLIASFILAGYDVVLGKVIGFLLHS